jgi:hypothetical protein
MQLSVVRAADAVELVILHPQCYLRQHLLDEGAILADNYFWKIGAQKFRLVLLVILG